MALSSLKQRIIGRRAAIASVRRGLRIKLRLQGYSRAQAKRLADDMPEKTILERIAEFLTEWGPSILKVIMALLPLLLLQEKPEGEPLTAIPADELDEIDGDYNALFEAAEAEPGRPRLAAMMDGVTDENIHPADGDPSGQELPPKDNRPESGPGFSGPCAECGAGPGEPCNLGGVPPELIDTLIARVKSRREAVNRQSSIQRTSVLVKYTTADGSFVMGPFSSRGWADQVAVTLVKAAAGRVENLYICPAPYEDVKELADKFRGR